MCDLKVTFVFHLFTYLFVAVPAPPSLSTKVVNSNVIQAMWEPSTKMGQHQGFRLYYRRANTPLFTGPFTFPRNVTQYNITQLGEICSFLVIELDPHCDLLLGHCDLSLETSISDVLCLYFFHYLNISFCLVFLPRSYTGL